MKEFYKHNAEEDEKNAKKIENLYLNQIEEFKQQIECEREKIKMDSKELMKNIQKLQSKLSDREKNHEAEIRRQNMINNFVIFFIFVALVGGVFLGMKMNYLSLFIIMIFMVIFIAYHMKKDFF